MAPDALECENPGSRLALEGPLSRMRWQAPQDRRRRQADCRRKTESRAIASPAGKQHPSVHATTKADTGRERPPPRRLTSIRPSGRTAFVFEGKTMRRCALVRTHLVEDP